MLRFWSSNPSLLVKFVILTCTYEMLRGNGTDAPSHVGGIRLSSMRLPPCLTGLYTNFTAPFTSGPLTTSCHAGLACMTLRGGVQQARMCRWLSQYMLNLLLSPWYVRCRPKPTCCNSGSKLTLASRVSAWISSTCVIFLFPRVQCSPSCEFFTLTCV
jgi:hypothetical protein